MKVAAKQGNTTAQFETAELYKIKLNDQLKALFWYQKLANLNNTDNEVKAKTQYELATHYYFAKQGKNEVSSIQWLTKHTSKIIILKQLLFGRHSNYNRPLHQYE